MIRLLVLALLLTGCSATAEVPSTPLVLNLSVEDASPQRVDAVRGQAVEISVSSKEPVDIHVHGFDVLAKAESGKPAVLKFVADRTGTFEVEAHPDTLLMQLVVR